jgi:protein-tyrosine phosphatase
MLLTTVDGYVDIHAHVLPGIDDGPADLDESLAMAQAAADSGIATIVSTPHLRSDFPDVHVDELAERCAALRESFERDGISLALVSGAEVSLTWAIEASDEQLKLASYGQRGTDLLIEAPFVKVVIFARAIHGLQTKGYRVTLGHPERSPQFQHDPAPLRELVAQDVLLQLNADSVLGPGGRDARRLARELLSDGLAHAIASDGHRGSSWRPVTRLAEAIQAATELVGPERAQWLAQGVPAAIVAGAELPDAPMIVPQRQPRRLFGLGRR